LVGILTEEGNKMSSEQGILAAARIAWGENTVDMSAVDWNWSFASGRRAAHGAGKRTPFDSFPLGVDLSLTVNTLVMYDAKLEDALGLINSEAGAELTEVTLSLGTIAVMGKLSGLAGKVDLENELQIAWTVTGTSKEAGAGSLLSAGAVFLPSTIVLTNLGTGLKLSTFNFNVGNAITPRRYMGGTRTPSVLAEGKQGPIGFDFSLLEVPDVPADITATDLAKIASATVAIEDSQTVPKTLTLTFAGVLPVDQTGSGNPDDIIEHGMKYEADTIGFGVA
jgi:hypothetical protein